MPRFEGKIALVTGAASGIGRATAEALAAEGAHVLAADIDMAKLRAVADGCGAEPLALDVTSVEHFDQVFAHIEAAHGRLDVLINNAGGSNANTRLEDMDFAEWDATMALLLRSVAIGTRNATRLMRKAGGGAIVNVSSVSAFDAGRSPLGYAVAKAGVLHLTKLSAAEVSRYGIRVNAVCPGLILTGIFSAAVAANADLLAQHPTLPQEIDDYMARIAPHAQPIAKAGLPDDVARTILFLASQDAAFITGTHVLIDGGLLVGPRTSWDPAAPPPADHPLNKLRAGT